MLLYSLLLCIYTLLILIRCINEVWHNWVFSRWFTFYLLIGRGPLIGQCVPDTVFWLAEVLSPCRGSAQNWRGSKLPKFSPDQVVTCCSNLVRPRTFILWLDVLASDWSRTSHPGFWLVNCKRWVLLQYIINGR